MRRVRPRGLSLIEVMISTLITALLLTAAGTAWTASCRAVSENDEFFRATQAARISMLQVLNQVRRTTGIANDGLGDHIDLFTFDSKHYVYQFSAAAQQLQLIDKTNAAQPVTHVLARNVSAASFAADMAPNPQTSISCAVHVSVSITVAVSNNSITLTGAAAPRINCHF